MLTFRRNISSVIFGFIYGFSFINGFEKGLEYVLRTEKYVLGQWPFIELTIKIISVIIASFLSAYSAQSVFAGVVAGSLLCVALLLPLQEPLWLIMFILLGIIMSILTSSISRKKPLDNNDILYRRFLGISWKHWLWLWLPSMYMVANTVWLAYPASIFYGHSQSMIRVVIEIIKAPGYVILMGWAMTKAFASLRAESGLTRTKSAFLFLFWFLLFPIIANILRVFKII